MESPNSEGAETLGLGPYSEGAEALVLGPPKCGHVPWPTVPAKLTSALGACADVKLLCDALSAVAS